MPGRCFLLTLTALLVFGFAGCGRNEPPLGTGEPLYGDAPFTTVPATPPADLGLLKDLKSYRPAKYKPLELGTLALAGPEDEIRQTLKAGLLALQKFDVAGVLELFDPGQIGPLLDDPTTLEDLADRLDRLNRLVTDKLGLPARELTAEQLDPLLAKLDIEVSGDQATVTLPADLMQQMTQQLAGPMGGAMPTAGAAPAVPAAPPAGGKPTAPPAAGPAANPRLAGRTAPEPNKAAAAKAAAATPPAAQPAAGGLAGLLTYEKDIRPIFEQHCFKCHDAENAFGGFVLDSYSSLMSTGEHAPVIKPGDPDNSRLWKLVSHAEQPNMPKKAPKLDDATLAKIRTWIQTGALEKLPGAGGPAGGLGGMPLGGAMNISFESLHMARREGKWRIELPWALTDRGAEFVNALCGRLNDVLDPLLEQLEHAEKLDPATFQQMMMQTMMGHMGDFMSLMQDYQDVIESLKQAPATEP